jgi:AAA domain
MTEAKDSKPNFPRLYTIHSQKGGVGKTSIAVAIAGFAAIIHNKKTLIVDADLTGTSLIDIPNFSSNDASTEKPYYFNELLLANPNEFQKYTPITGLPDRHGGESKRYLDHFYQSVPNYENISYLPASPSLSDIQKTIPLISQEDHLSFFRLRMEDILVTAMLDGFEVIIVDHPPGLYGISTASLNIVLDQKSNNTSKSSRLSNLMNGSGMDLGADKLSCHAILCTTSDPVDYKALIPSLSMILDKKDGYSIDNGMEIDIFLNKGIEDPTAGRFDPTFALKKVFDDLKGFQDHRVVNSELLKILKTRVSQSGAAAGENIKHFSMDQLFPTISKLSQNNKSKSFTGMEGWCSQLGQAVNLFSNNKSF